eukprot:3602978-Rhodomonas_salina.4
MNELIRMRVLCLESGAVGPIEIALECDRTRPWPARQFKTTVRKRKTARGYSFGGIEVQSNLRPSYLRTGTLVDLSDGLQAS